MGCPEVGTVLCWIRAFGFAVVFIAGAIGIAFVMVFYREWKEKRKARLGKNGEQTL